MPLEIAVFEKRLTRFQSTLLPKQAALLSSVHDIQYFSQFEFLVPEEREAFLLVTGNEAYLIISSFSPAPQLPFLRILRGTSPSHLANHLEKILKEKEIAEIGFQDHSLFVNEFSALHKVAGKNIKLSPLPPKSIWQQRMLKDQVEIDHLREAGKIVAEAVSEIEAFFTVGVRELELAEKLAELFKKKGADGLGFPTIVAFGAHGTSPHHQPGNTPLTEDTSILIDCGAMVSGYRSDITRTWWFGKNVAEEFSVIEGVVKTAYELAWSAVNTPDRKVTAKNLDELTRKFITKEGYGNQFIHTTGHGVGLDIHEPPSLSWSDETVLKSGMVITIEPGIYLENKFGYRFENSMLLTDTGAEILTQ